MWRPGCDLGRRGLVALAPANLPRLDSVSIDIPVLGFAFVLSTAVAAGLGAFTAARATSGDLREDLADGRGGSPRRQRVGRVIVAGQMAITLMLVVGAGLFGRSLMKVLDVNPGFRVDEIITMDVALPRLEDPNARAGQAMFFSRLIDRLERIPGLQAPGSTRGLPMDGGLPDGMFLLTTPDETPRTTDELGPLFRQKGEPARRTSASPRPATSRRSAFRSFAGAPSTAATPRMLHTWP